MSDAIKKLFDDEYLETMLVLRKDWDKPEEDAVWEFLQESSKKSGKTPVNPL
ncbi:hypothetical protein KC976_01050 [Candidatus Saccharibacteria bacterium]|nr:hypothetical protein [Candidatus Saccharibacteria bacterium]HPG37232.1 hypothetical protein [Candidatus Saccharibacteria bacterium]